MEGAIPEVEPYGYGWSQALSTCMSIWSERIERIRLAQEKSCWTARGCQQASGDHSNFFKQRSILCWDLRRVRYGCWLAQAKMAEEIKEMERQRLIDMPTTWAYSSTVPASFLQPSIHCKQHELQAAEWIGIAMMPSQDFSRGLRRITCAFWRFLVGPSWWQHAVQAAGENWWVMCDVIGLGHMQECIGRVAVRATWRFRGVRVPRPPHRRGCAFQQSPSMEWFLAWKLPEKVIHPWDELNSAYVFLSRKDCNSRCRLHVKNTCRLRNVKL